MKRIFRNQLPVFALAMFLGVALVFTEFAQAQAPLDIATTPLSNNGPKKVKPNMLYVLDDSKSMEFEYMPDWTEDVILTFPNTRTPNPSHIGLTYHTDPSYNALAYNPAVRYTPPTNYTSTGAPDTTTYPSQTGMSTATGASSASKPNWKNVKNNAYSGTSTKDLETNGTTYKNADIGNPQYTISVANEYCTRTDLRVCISSSVPTNTYPYPARIRWCNSSAIATNTAVPAANACQSVRTGTFVHMRVPLSTVALPTQATITFDWAFSDPRINGITINGQQIMDGNTGTSNNTYTLADRVESEIDSCTNSKKGNCTVSGYSASRSGNVLTIYAPSAVSGTPNLQYSNGYLGYSVTAFAAPGGVPANNRVTVSIVRSNNSYVYPGTTTKHAARTDCAGSTCTYNEEMTNYANWYTYYRSRMQMMKTATSIAFETIGDDLRMGFMTINVATNGRALDFKDFSGADKAAWYKKLFDTVPDWYSGTPLREALSKSGQIYAKKFNANNVFKDPVQYECQDNFTLLTTDGKWNSAAGAKLDGKSMTDQDNNNTEKGKYQGSNKSSDTLADVAKYYRDTDLRDSAYGNCTGALGSNVCDTAGTSPLLNREQTMVTFTLGLGVDGTLAYDAEYGPNVAGDFKQIYDGTKQWPKIIDNDETTIDDLWHAAINGDGRYFSAKKTTDLIEQLREAIALIKVNTGAGAAAATSTLNPVSGDNYAYVASYTTGYWKGNLEKRLIDVNDGSIGKDAKACVEDVIPTDSCSSPSTIEDNGSGGYSCVTKNVTDQALCTTTLVGSECRVPIFASCEGALKKQSLAARKIYMNKSGTLSDFTFTNLTANQAINFSSSFLQANLTQGSTYTGDQLVNLTGDNLVNYLKGYKTYELNSAIDNNQLFRKRTALLGDLIDSKPSFLGKPTFNYGDSGYQAFKLAKQSRAGRVYVGSNDGMLHAFDSDTLQEKWAFVPSAVIPHMWKLADSNYGAKHQYFVNGDVVISDICVAANCATATASDWRTILVAGLDAGGRGYYALDITDPDTPSVLWEISPSSDASLNNLGYTYGNPVITKRNGDEKWVVVFTSGYNNIPDNNSFYSSAKSTEFKPTITSQLQFNTGNGQGYLYVVDAKSGSRLATIATGSGSVSSPSGLAKISAYANNGEVNNVTKYVYGGDLNGDVWRFNIDSTANSVLHFAQLKNANNIAQPVMTPPELGLVGNKKVIFVGTGKYLEITDLDVSQFSTQSLYALKDVANDGDAGPVYNNPRSIAGVVKQTIVPNSDPTKSDERVSGTNNGVDLSTGIGWYIDFPDNGERQNIASQLVLGTLLVPTTVPTASACQPSGYGWFNYLNYKTGLSVIKTYGAVSQRTSAPSVGFNVVYVNGKPAVSNVLSDDPNPFIVDGIGFLNGAGEFNMRRSIWREIVE